MLPSDYFASFTSRGRALRAFYLFGFSMPAANQFSALANGVRVERGLLVSADVAAYSVLMAQAKLMIKAIGDPVGSCALQLE